MDSRILLNGFPPNEAVLEIRRIPIDSGNNSGEPGPGLTTGNKYLNLDDPALKVILKKILSGNHTRIQQLKLIQEWVSQNMNFKYGAALFGSSSEILKHMTGDCSEAAILTAALLRANKIPAKVAVGFVHYGKGVFIGHAWTEAWIGKWISIDAALNENPSGALRIKLANLTGEEDMRIQATNVLLQVISNLGVEILEIWQGDQKIPLIKFEEGKSISSKFIEELFDNMQN